MRIEYVIKPRKIALLLGSIALYLGMQSLVIEYLIENVLNQTSHSTLISGLDLFSVNAELTIPTWFSAILLFTSAVLFMVIATAKNTQKAPYAYHWSGLVVIFLYLSVDEGAAIHEIAADVLEAHLDLTGYLYFGWQIVAVPLVVIFLLIYLRFWMHLPGRTRILFAIVAVAYLGGALVVEGISANQWYLDGGQTFQYLAIATVEEVSEMLGVIVLIYALLKYILEMNYVIVLHPTAAGIQRANDQVSLQSDAPRQAQQPRPLWMRRVATIMLGLILVANVLLISAILVTVNQETVANNQAILEQLSAYEDVLVTPVEGHFDTDNLPARQTVAALLAEYDNVTVITWSSSHDSIALAANNLPFDRNSLMQLLSEHGETQFVIFDTLAAQAIVGNVQPAEIR